MSDDSHYPEDTAISTRDVSRVGRVESVRVSYRILARRWWVIAVSVLVGLACATFACIFTTPEYQAVSTLYVTSGSDANAQSAYQGSLASQQRVASYTRLVTSDAVLDDAVKRSGLQMSVDEARSRVSASTTADTVLLTVRAVDTDPDVAAVLANSVSGALVDYVKDLEVPSEGGPALAKVTVVTPASVHAEPVSPRWSRSLVLYGLIGLFVGILAVFLIDRLDSRIRGASEVEALVRKPNLSIVPDNIGKGGDGLVDFKLGASPGAESYRKLRTNLDFVEVDSPPRIITVTSPAVGEGKTTTAINLSRVLAESGRSVVLVDGDLRKPTVAARLGLSGHVGFTDYVMRGGDFREYVQKTDVAGMDVVSSGATPPNPSELVGSQVSGRAISQLASQYDYVIVDSPPVLPVTDAVVLSRWTDGIVMVVRFDRTRREDVIATIKQLGSASSRILGTVCNGAPSRELYESYAYYGESSRGNGPETTISSKTGSDAPRA